MPDKRKAGEQDAKPQDNSSRNSIEGSDDELEQILAANLPPQDIAAPRKIFV